MIKLILKFNGALVRECSIEKPETWIGRKPENDLVIDNPAVSGQHCRIIKESTGYFVEDSKSTNGTFIGEKRVTRELLHPQDELRIAKHVVCFFNDEEPLSPEKKDSAGSFSSEATVIFSSPPAAPKAMDRLGHLRVLWGGKAEAYPLTQMTSYIGKSSQALIRMKGIFAPDLAACVAKKADGYYLTPLKEGTVKLNGDGVIDQAQVLLREGDLVDVGNLKLMFFLQENPAPGSGNP